MANNIADCLLLFCTSGSGKSMHFIMGVPCGVQVVRIRPRMLSHPSVVCCVIANDMQAGRDVPLIVILQSTPLLQPIL